MRSFVLIAIVAAVPAALAAQQNVADAAATITPAQYIEKVGIIAHDSMGGRDTPSPGLDLTAAWIAARFRAIGLTPGADGSFLQRYPLERVRLDTARSMITAGGTTWRFGPDAIKLAGGDAPDGATGPTVVVFGNPQGDATALTDLPLDGSVALVLLPTTGGRIGRAEFRHLLGVARQDPAAVIAIADVSDAFFAQLGQGQLGTNLVAPWTATDRPPIALVRASAAAAALGPSGFDVADAMTKLDGPIAGEVLSRTAVTVRTTGEVVEVFTAPNVVGVLEGRDPALRNEYLVYSAHMDHVGTGRPVGGDSIYNGADDDASGTIAVVEVAEAFAALDQAPRRSVIFLLVSGEEHGLWGSDWFAAHPPVPVEQIVANLNADMVGRNWSDTIVAIGKEHSDLGQTLARVNAAHPELDMTAIDDLWPDERFYFRSDHYNFAKRGVPVLFFFNGVHEDYHRPSDHVEKIDEEKASRIAKLLFYLGLEVANADARPQWNPESYEQIVTDGR